VIAIGRPCRISNNRRAFLLAQRIKTLVLGWFRTLAEEWGSCAIKSTIGIPPQRNCPTTSRLS
jgi:hypothetical protein